MDLIKGVYNIATDLLFIPTPTRQHAKINEEKLIAFADEMKLMGKVSFYSEEPQEVSEEKNELFIVLRELVASSINYCYWYGNSLIRPNGASSTGMYNLVDAALETHKDPMDVGLNQCSIGHYERLFKESIGYLIELLASQRYPMLEERKRHLLELVEDGKAITFAKYVVLNKDKHGEELLEDLIRNFTGFASDTFLKRASLFFIQLNRQLGCFDGLVNDLFVPADYQVPKMLEYFGVIKYSNDLGFKITEGKLIEKGSLMEVQIRAATIMACRKLCKLTGWNVAEVDTYLWTKRKLPRKRFHLTYTTDY